MKLRWSHAVVYVSDLDAMIGFYSDVLGFEVSDRGPLDPNMPEIEVVFMTQVGTDHHQIAFAPVRSEDMKSNFDHIAFRVDSLADVKQMASRLSAAGHGAEVAPVNHGNAWSIYFKDPEGNGIEIFCDSPYHVNQPQLTGWSLEDSEDDLRKATEEQFGSEAGFSPMDEYTARRKAELGD